MAKVPVGKTIQQAYAFTFGHLGTIIGLIWLPMILVTVGNYFIMMPYYQSISDAWAQDNPAAVGQASVLLFGFALIALVLYAMMNVSVTQEALGQRKGNPVIHIALGPPEWRMFAAMLALICALAAVMLGIVLAFALAGSVIGLFTHAGAATPPHVTATTIAASPQAVAGILVATLLFIAILAVVTFVAVRLGYLLSPVTVVEERVSLSRGWELTQGNFWRVFAIALATLLPVALIVGAVQTILVGPTAFAPHPTPAEALLAAQRMRANLPWISGLNFLAAPFWLGLALSGSAFTYRALTAGDAARSPLSSHDI